MKKIIVVDGQGGNIGKQIVKSIKENFPKEYVRAVGTNSVATANMLKAGADEGATGENAVVVACKEADIIVGPIGIIIADALLGEVSKDMAYAISSSNAKKVLIPLNKCDVLVSGVKAKNTNELLEDTIKILNGIIK